MRSLINHKRSNSLFDLSVNSNNLLNSKRSQAEVIVTVLLILISLAAVAVVSVFVFNLVRQNLSGTDCFKIVGQFEIKSGDEGVSCYDASATQLKLTINRGAKLDYNLTSLSIVYGNSNSSKSYSQVSNLPAAGEKRTYTINTSDLQGAVETASIVPLIGKGTTCEEGKAEAQISAC